MMYAEGLRALIPDQDVEVDVSLVQEYCGQVVQVIAEQRCSGTLRVAAKMPDSEEASIDLSYRDLSIDWRNESDQAVFLVRKTSVNGVPLARENLGWFRPGDRITLSGLPLRGRNRLEV